MEKRFAACAQILDGITSIYWWKKAVQREREVLLLIKTRESLVGEIEKQFESLHPYDVPELIVLPIGRGSRKYIKWLEENTLER